MNSSRSYCQIWCLRFSGHAAIWSVCVISIPSLNLMPVMTFASSSKPRSFLQLFSAHWASLYIMCSIPSRVRHPFDRFVRCLMVAKVDSIGLLGSQTLKVLCSLVSGMFISPITEKKPKNPWTLENLKRFQISRFFDVHRELMIRSQNLY